jgi:succinate dehydrogenase/fumarate reductase cytochrome b subunit
MSNRNLDRKLQAQLSMYEAIFQSLSGLAVAMFTLTITILVSVQGLQNWVSNLKFLSQVYGLISVVLFLILIGFHRHIIRIINTEYLQDEEHDSIQDTLNLILEELKQL